MKNILILGATSDMAEAIAYKFASEKNNIIVAARNSSRLKPLQSDLTIKYSVKVEVVEFNASDFSSHEIFYKGLSLKPDVVICVFGYLGEQQIAEKNWSETLNIIHSNYTGAVSILNIAANDFEERKTGSIIGISSVAGERGRQSNYTYGSAKAAFSVYLDGLRNRLFKSNVHVMTVKPGFVKTKMLNGMQTPGPLTATTAQVANDVYKGYQKKSNTLYTLWMWKYVMMIIKSIPEPVFKKLKL